MGMVLHRLLVVLLEENLDTTSYHVARILINNFAILNQLTIDQVARLCDVSKSTVSKFIRKIGFSDYGEFRDALPNVPHSQFSYNTNVMNYLENNSFDDYSQLVIANINLLAGAIENSNARALVEDLVAYDKVAAFGLLYSQTAAIDLQTKLAYNDKYIYTCLNDVKQHEYIEAAQEDSLIIIFSHSGDYLRKHQMTQGNITKSAFKKTKAKIVVITANFKMEDNPLVDYCVLYPAVNEITTHSIIFALISDYLTLHFRQATKSQP
ncbi:MAG: hypothetical protein PHI41_07130 [Erysipelotrichaceae bacterium]|nr:hypothetical protein [Erysipelotrichaceae bacterium]MDD3810066.1 hypothetical protein [Erysipelotrichaceae bacterium]